MEKYAQCLMFATSGMTLPLHSDVISVQCNSEDVLFVILDTCVILFLFTTIQKMWTLSLHN